MSANCLLTKLKATVNNPDLEKLGVFRLYASHMDNYVKANHGYLAITVNSPVTVKIAEGSGTFDIDGGPTNQTTYTIEKDPGSDYPKIAILYFSNPNVNTTYIIELSNKYAIKALTNYYEPVTKINGPIDSLTGLTNITMPKAGISGDINKIASLLGSVGYNNIEGDISSFANAGLVIKNNYCYGDFTALLQATTSSEVQQLDSLRGNGKVGHTSTIDASLTPDNIRLLSCDGFKTDLNAIWTTTRSSNYIVALQGPFHFGTYLDAMLINQANCELASDLPEGDTVYTTINAYGVETGSSAEIDAIDALIGMGVSVVINGVVKESSQSSS